MNAEEQARADEAFAKRMDAKHELARSLNHYDINTSTVYYELRDKWKNYDREIIDRIEEGISVAHRAKEVMTYCNDGTDIAQMKINGHMRSLSADRKATAEAGRFPIEYYYMGGYYNKMEYIVCMEESCKVEKDGYEFDLLFAMQFSLTPLVIQTGNKELMAKKPTLHLLRHSIATHMTNRGADVNYVRRFLGHTSLNTTVGIYAKRRKQKAKLYELYRRQS